MHKHPETLIPLKVTVLSSSATHWLSFRQTCDFWPATPLSADKVSGDRVLVSGSWCFESAGTGLQGANFISVESVSDELLGGGVHRSYRVVPAPSFLLTPGLAAVRWEPPRV